MKLDPLDKLFSEYIRKRAISRVGGCERCLAQKNDVIKDNCDIFPAWQLLDCAHFYPRTKRSVRWDIDNALGLCSGCHMFIDNNATDKVEFFLNRLGQEAFDFLTARMRQTYPKPDKGAIALYLRAKIEDLTTRAIIGERD